MHLSFDYRIGTKLCFEIENKADVSILLNCYDLWEQHSVHKKIQGQESAFRNES